MTTATMRATVARRRKIPGGRRSFRTMARG
jgi:hypothetical protein